MAILRRILTFWRPHRRVGAGLIVTMLLQALFTVVVALSIKLIIDAVVVEMVRTHLPSVTPTTTLSLDSDQFRAMIEGTPDMAAAVQAVAGARSTENGTF